MADILKQGSSKERLKVTCQQGIALAERLGNNPAKATLSTTLSSFN